MRVSSSKWFFAALAVFALQAPASSQIVEIPRESALTPPRPSPAARYPQAQLTPAKSPTAPAVSGLTRKTYALAELSDDPALGAWVAENIPQIVQPGTWNIGDAPHKPVLSYFGPSKILLVYHTPTAHAEIDEFILSVKKSAAAKATHKPVQVFGVAPAQFTAVDSMPAAAAVPVPHSSGYPVPAQARQPRHLFHFVIRYEGEGVIDSNVVDFMKLQGAGDSGAAQQGSCRVPARSDPAAPAASQKLPCMPECLPPASTSSTSVSNAVFSTALGASLIGNAFPVQLLPIVEAVAPRK